MDSGQRVLIKSSFQHVLAVSDLAGELFSGRLYLLNTELWNLLGVGAHRRQQELVRMLAQAVEDLDRFEYLASTLEAIARRYVSHGVSEAQFDTIAETLLWTLQQVLGDAYDEKVAAAWRSASALLLGRVKSAASSQVKAPRTLRRIRRSSCPEHAGGSYRQRAARASVVHEHHEDEAEIEAGRLAELPPAPASARRQSMPLSSRLTPTHR